MKEGLAEPGLLSKREGEVSVLVSGHIFKFWGLGVETAVTRTSECVI